MDILALREQLMIDEGYIEEIYADHLGYHTFGIGHLITRHDSEWGKPIGTAISKDRIYKAFKEDIGRTIEHCEKIYNDFYFLPEEVQQILANMMYNLGPTGLKRFKRMNIAIKNHQWKDAAEEMRDSKWYHQVSKRSKRLYDRMMDVK